MLSEFLLEGIRELSVLKFYGREQSEQDTEREKGRERKGERVTATYSSVLSLSSSTGKPGFMADEDLTQFLIKQEFGFLEGRRNKRTTGVVDHFLALLQDPCI